jgi:lipopolysaccharide/colanic/teichoic acid biosynthesis glycosyltransferase
MKRLFDFIFAAVGLIALSPLMAVIAVLVKVTSTGPVIHRARRAGCGGVPFTVFKFRSMVVSPSVGSAITRRRDPRVTAVGKILRKTKLDELPQLFNVLRGDMSLVGPRPEDPRYTSLYDEEQRAILEVRPGMTSAASLVYRDEASMLDGDDWERVYVEQIMPEKLRIDLEYFRSSSFWSDWRLVARTIAVLLFRRQRGAARRRAARPGWRYNRLKNDLTE